MLTRPGKTEVVATDAPTNPEACLVHYRPRSLWDVEKGGAAKDLVVADPLEVRPGDR